MKLLHEQTASRSEKADGVTERLLRPTEHALGCLSGWLDYSSLIGFFLQAA
jgi:hypothetical protein